MHLIFNFKIKYSNLIMFHSFRHVYNGGYLIGPDGNRNILWVYIYIYIEARSRTVYNWLWIWVSHANSEFNNRQSQKLLAGNSMKSSTCFQTGLTLVGEVASWVSQSQSNIPEIRLASMPAALFSHIGTMNCRKKKSEK